MTHILIPTGGFPPDIGGPATYVPRIATALTERGHQVTVVTLTPARNHADTIYPFQVVRIPMNMNRIMRWINVLLTLIKLMKTADLLYVNGLLMETAVASLFRPRRMIAKVVGDIVWERAQDKGWINDSIDVFQQQQYSVPIERRRKIRNWAIRRMEQVIVPSNYLKNIVVGWGIQAENVTVIYNAYYPAKETVKLDSIPLTTPIKLITVCRLVRWKRVDQLIPLLLTLPDVGLIIIGDGPERTKLETQVSTLQLTNRVHFTGNVTQSAVVAALKLAHLFVLNSTYEGLPHVLLEALAVRLPILATNVGGMPEVVQEGINGRLIPVDDPKQLQQVMQQMLNHPNAYAVTLPTKFTPQVMMAQTFDILIPNGDDT
ncbi:MAG: glycosyltransferase family 4 protein [Chloroflexi bacterium]|nr:glycosyltransferase family 4 protein [Chloroflexota bacterium]